MADFTKSYVFAGGHEGGFSHDPNDAGGMTWRGIARRYHPRWTGWAIVDAAIRAQGLKPAVLNGVLGANQTLARMERDFYREGWWLPILGDDIPVQALADQLYQITINMDGRGNAAKKATRFLQTALNYYNYNNKTNKPLFTDLTEDGRAGKYTLAALDLFLALYEPGYLALAIEWQQGAYYLASTKKRNLNRKFSRGWAKRASESSMVRYKRMK